MNTLYPEPPLVLKKRLMPLYEAMKKDLTIKSVTCTGADTRYHGPTGEFKIENFKVFMYYHIIAGKKNYVQTDNGRSFFMKWVKEFEL